jgi:hypothetical protein
VGVNCEWIDTKIKNCESMPDQELQVQKKAKNKEKREWKKEIREEKQESNLIRRFETVIKSLLLLYVCNSTSFIFIILAF